MDPAARLGQLRERAAGEGAEWLRSKVEGMQRDELQSLAAVVHAPCILTPSIVKIHFMFMCFAAASFPARYILDIAMASRTVWIAAREKDIERAFNDKKL